MLNAESPFPKVEREEDIRAQEASGDTPPVHQEDAPTGTPDTLDASPQDET